MVVGANSHPARRGGVAPPPALKSVRPKLFRRASLTSWGKNNLGMTRAAAVNLKELMLTVQQQKYEDRDKATQREISRNEGYEGEQSTRHRDERRSRLLLRSTARRDFLENWEREGRAKWNANQAALCRYERRLLNYELAVKATGVARQRMSQARHSDDQAEGVRWFEHNLDRLGLDPGGDSAGGGGGAGAGGGALLPDKETPATFRSRLVRAVLDQKFVPSSNAETMAELRFRGITGRRGRQEREHRRVKTEVDQRRAKAETDAQRSTDRHLKGMLSEGRERRELASACWAERHDLEQKALSDKKRFAEKAAAQEDAFETVFNVRAGHARERYKAGGDEREAKTNVLRARLQKNREEKRRRVEMMCSQIAHKMSDLAVVASEARASQGGVPLPPTTWARLKRWFCSSDPFFVDTAPSEPPPEPSNPVLDAKAFLERQNLDRYEGSWRLPGGLPAELPGGPSPLSRALGIARDLVEASGNRPREGPTYGRRRRASACGDQETSVRLVLLGQRDGLGELCVELGPWARLYVCSLETALECAMEVGAEEAAYNGKGSKGRKDSVSGRKNSVGGDVGRSTTDGDVTLAVANAKEVTIQKCFHPDATEEDVVAFKTAAVAYHALRTHPKKAAAPVPLVTTTDLLVKHLSCRTPRGHGWLLVGYPSCLLESKLLENALSGYTDAEVAAELGTSGKSSKPETKTKKGSTIPQPQEIEPQIVPRSGLDAILNLSRLRSTATHRANHPEDSPVGTEGDEEAGVLDDGLAAAAQATEDSGETDQGKGKKEDEENDIFEERDEQVEWWQGFEGGHLPCDVLNEANDERLLETLFLLVNAARNRKEDHEAWLKDAASAQKILEDEAAQILEGSSTAEPDGDDAKTVSTAAAVVDQHSPLAVPLTASLEDLRSERRASMSHSTRIQVEASTGDRELDLEGVRLAISQTEARREGGIASACAPPPSLTAALRQLEAECPALFVVDWAALAEFSFSKKLRAPDDRWTTACLQLEGEIADWLTRRDDALVAASNNRRSGGRAIGDGYNDCSVTASAVPPAEGDRVWKALEAFQLGAGDVVDDRHSSAETTMREIDDEADQKVRGWIGNVENAAADLCAAERASYHETVETLRTLDALFGLQEEHTSSNADRIRAVTCTAADTLATELSTTSQGRHFASEGGCLEEEVRRAVQEVCQDNGTNPSAREPRPKLAPLPVVGFENQQEALLPQGHEGTEEGASLIGRSNDRAGLNSEPTSDGAEPGVDAGGGGSEGDKESGSLTTAIWLCRLQYICRLRGVVMRLVRAVGRCEAKVLSMRASLRRLKRRRVQLEHEGFSVATSTVRRALEECDHAIIADILENGIPVWVEDDETFAADPYVALPWGMSGLSLPHIVSLTRTLRRSFAGAEGDAGGTILMPVSELSSAVRTWSHSERIESNGDGEREDIPRAWTGPSSGYIETLCGAIAGGVNTDKVSWRRLVHCLLLGHVRSLPTLDDLRFMRHAFGLKASTSSRTSSAEALKRSSTTGGIESAENAAMAASSAKQTPTLRFAQRHIPGIPLWFEQQDNQAGYGGERAESDSWSSTVRAMYTEAWGGGDGRVDGMDLLLTLCEVPGDSTAGAVSLGADEEDDWDSGTLFSPGLFRAFSMLADSPSSATDNTMMTTASIQGLGSAGTVTTTVEPPSSSAGNPQEGSAAAAGASPSSDVGDDGVPRVSLPQLRAILEHGGGMTTTDMSGICELVARREEESQSQRQRLQRDTTAAIVGAEEAVVEDVGSAGRPTEDEDRDIVNRETTTDRDGGGGSFAAEKKRQLQQEQPALTVSFATVSECGAVRAWLRKGAYSLPAFDVTSGQRRDIR